MGGNRNKGIQKVSAVFIAGKKKKALPLVIWQFSKGQEENDGCKCDPTLDISGPLKLPKLQQQGQYKNDGHGRKGGKVKSFECLDPIVF